MSPIKEKAIVLRSIRHGESSRILTLFGETIGKLAVISKGARKGKSGAHGGLVAPPSLIEAVIHMKKSREVQILGQVESLKNFTRIKNNLVAIGYAAGILELVNRGVTEGESNTNLFRDIVDTLDDISDSKSSFKVILWKFQLNLLKAIGFEFSPSICAGCGQTKTEIHPNNSISFEDGCVICKDCIVSFKPSLVITGESLSILRNISLRNDKLYQRIKPSKNAQTEISAFLERYQNYHHAGFGRLPAMKMIDTLEFE